MNSQLVDFIDLYINIAIDSTQITIWNIIT